MKLKSESFLQAIGSATFWRSLDTLSGLAKHVIVAGAIGLSAKLDVFYMASALLTLLVLSWGNVLDVLAVPQLVKHWKDKDLPRFNQLAGGLLGLSFLLSAGLCLLVYSGRGLLAQVAWGFEPARQALLADAFIWLLPVVACYLPSRCLTSVFRATRQFSAFNQAEFVVTAVALALVASFPTHATVLLWSYAGGTVAGFLYLALRAASWFRPSGSPFSPAVKLVLLGAPALIMLRVIDSLYHLTDRVFLSYLPERAVGALVYAYLMAGLASQLFFFGNAFISVFSERRASGESGVGILDELASLSLLVGIPAGIFLGVFGDGVVRLLFERGAFGPDDTRLTASALMGYAPGVTAWLLLGPLAQTFQVLGRTRVLAGWVGICLVLNLALNSLFMFGFGWGVWGIAVAASSCSIVSVLLSVHFLASEGLGLAIKRHLVWGFSLALVGLGATLVTRLWGALGQPPWLIVPQALTFGLLIAGWALVSPLPEGRLVRRTLARLRPRPRGASDAV